MSHFFLNVVDNESEAFKTLNSNKNKFCFVLPNKMNGTIFYDNDEWLTKPFLSSEQSSLYLAGWFIFNNKKNDLSGLKKKIDQNFENGDIKDFDFISEMIDAGVFIALYVRDDKYYIFSDPFSLSPHYYRCDRLEISPFPCRLSDGDDDIMVGILNKQGHLFGKYTVFEKVYRFLPNDVLCFNLKSHEINIFSNRFKLVDVQCDELNVMETIKKLTSYWSSKELSLALSAGFDSRLISSACEPMSTYTWGPFSSQDQVVASKISKYKKTQHFPFLFKKPSLNKRHEDICSELFGGVVKNYNTQLLANYEYVSSLTSENHIALDGYLGDVLQRGVYLYPSGLKGELFKLLPSLLPYCVSSKDILRSRYKSLDDYEFQFLYIDFKEKTKHLDNIDELSKVTFYEFLYGRGLRYITSGAIVMNSLYKTIVPCFSHKEIFSSLLKCKVSDVLTYKVFSKIWIDVEDFYKTLKSEGLYSPDTKPFLIPFFNVVGRLVTNKIPRYHNYTRE